MEYKVLYRKYRPKDFNSVVGQEYILKTLKNAIISDKCSHAYIFSGPRGTGKTSMAKILAKSINCTDNKDGNPCDKCYNCQNFANNPDIIEIDAASNNGVDDIRELINNVKIAPAYSKYKVYIIDEVHMLSQSAFNALLLTLEEPPGHIVFILATTDIQNVPITVLSRCQRFDVKRISIENAVKKLKEVSESENIKISTEALEEIAYLSEGGLRDALSILDQLITDDNKEITIEEIAETFGTVSINSIRKLIDNLENNNINEIIVMMDNLNNSGIGYRIFIEKLIKELKIEAINRKIINKNYNLTFENIKNLIFDLNNCLINIKSSINPYLLIEITLLNYTNPLILSTEEKSETILEETTTEELSKEDYNDVELTIKKEKKKNSFVKNEISLSDIRINNCFVNAKKEYMLEIKSDWDNFKIYLKKEDKKLLSLVLDSEIATASDKYIIIVSEFDSQVNLINENLQEITAKFLDCIQKNYLFSAISVENWKIEREKYIKNIKNNIKYTMLDETKNILSADKDNKIQNMAKEIFGNTLEIK